MSGSLDAQAEALHRLVADLMRSYQLRDRDEICCRGITVAQCYALEAIGDLEQPRMNDVARRLRLKDSTLTRTVDQLVDGGLVQRCLDPRDRRVCCVALTRAGRAKLERVRRELVVAQKAVLARIAPEHRDALIDGLTRLASALSSREETKR